MPSPHRVASNIYQLPPRPIYNTYIYIYIQKGGWIPALTHLVDLSCRYVKPNHTLGWRSPSDQDPLWAPSGTTSTPEHYPSSFACWLVSYLELIKMCSTCSNGLVQPAQQPSTTGCMCVQQSTAGISYAWWPTFIHTTSPTSWHLHSSISTGYTSNNLLCNPISTKLLFVCSPNFHEDQKLGWWEGTLITTLAKTHIMPYW